MGCFCVDHPMANGSVGARRDRCGRRTFRTRQRRLGFERSSPGSRDVECRGTCGRSAGASIHQSDTDVVDPIVVRHGRRRRTAFLRADSTGTRHRGAVAVPLRLRSGVGPIDPYLRRSGGHQGRAVLQLQNDDRSHSGRRSGRYARGVPRTLSRQRAICARSEMGDHVRSVPAHRGAQRHSGRPRPSDAGSGGRDSRTRRRAARRDLAAGGARARDARCRSRVRCSIRTFISATGT